MCFVIARPELFERVIVRRRKKQEIFVLPASKLDQITVLSIFSLQQRLVQELEIQTEDSDALKVHVYSNGKADSEAEKAVVSMGGS